MKKVISQHEFRLLKELEHDCCRPDGGWDDASWLAGIHNFLGIDPHIGETVEIVVDKNKKSPWKFSVTWPKNKG